MLFRYRICLIRSAGDASCVFGAKRRSKTSWGLISLAIGVFADRQEMFDE